MDRRAIVAGAAGSEAIAEAARRQDPAQRDREAFEYRLEAKDAPPSVSCASASTSGVCCQLVMRPRESGRKKGGAEGGVSIASHSVATVYEAPLDAKLVQGVRTVFEHLRRGKQCPHTLTHASKRLLFHVEKPTWKSDIRWISARDEGTFAWFASLFEKLGVRRTFSFLGELVLFSGFIVARQSTRKSHFHTDFDGSGGKALTLMTPLYDMSSLSDCHLVCEDGASLVQYRYTLGKAILFGDHFVHATQTGESPFPIAFLSFTFGAKPLSDDEWRSAEAYVMQQNPIYQDPMGRIVKSSAFQHSKLH
ncbi:hypothetical protein AB1Y20_018178 [Prymnesium parvum]|uniref:Aspartyl/asparaginy/proline hydroxylase domain-containing protein n=1 Tax=Prymnesium parvum TaxID=97485 RepID=A0AB34JNW5_PRYPA